MTSCLGARQATRTDGTLTIIRDDLVIEIKVAMVEPPARQTWVTDRILGRSRSQ